MIFFNEFLFNSCIIENIRTFITFNKTFVVNNLFLKLFTQTTRRRKLFNIKFFHLLISYLKLFNSKFYEFFEFFVKIVKNVINDFFQNNNLNIDQFKCQN